MTGELDSRRHYILINHTIVSFFFEGLKGLVLNGFNNQNVISCLTLQKTCDIYALTLGHCYRVEGRIDAAHVRIELLPGTPEGGIYSAQLVREVHFLARFKSHCFSRNDGNLCASARITSNTGFARPHIEDTKAPQLDPVPGPQGILQAIENGIHSCFNLVPR